MKPPPDKQTILDSLAAIARGAGRAPSRSEFLSLSGISEHQVSQFFPTWNDAVRAAGLRPNILNVHLKDSELLEDWALAVRRNRKIPARRAYRHLGQYDPRTFERRFGPWSKLPEVFRISLEVFQCQKRVRNKERFFATLRMTRGCGVGHLESRRLQGSIHSEGKRPKTCHPEGRAPKSLSS